MLNFLCFPFCQPLVTYHSHLTVNRRPVPHALNVERQSHVISVVLLVNLMSDVSPAATSGFFAVTLDWLAERVLNARVVLAFVEGVAVNGLRAVAGEELAEDGVEHDSSDSDAEQNHSQVAGRLCSLFDSLAQRLSFADFTSSIGLCNCSVPIASCFCVKAR